LSHSEPVGKILLSWFPVLTEGGFMASYGSLLAVTIMNKPKIIAYLKPSCGWSNGVRAVLRKYDLPYEDRDIINDPVQRAEMIEKSGQMLSPCVEINGHMLPDISGEEVEAWMLANNVVTPNNRVPDAPTNQPCAHEMPASSPLNFGVRR
jgi:glutaredoxin